MAETLKEKSHSQADPFFNHLGWMKDSTGSLSGGLKFLAISIEIGGVLVLSTKALKH